MLHILVSKTPLTGTEQTLDTGSEELETHEIWWLSTNWISSCFSAVHYSICLCIKMMWFLILTLTLAFDLDFDLGLWPRLWPRSFLFQLLSWPWSVWELQESWNVPAIYLFMWHMCPTNLLPHRWPHACAWALFHKTMDLFPVNVQDISESLRSQMALFFSPCIKKPKL